MKNPFKIITSWFKKPTAASIAADKLAQAEILAMEHLEATNFHGHQHQFYTLQIETLKRQLGHYEAPLQEGKQAPIDLTSVPIPIQSVSKRQRVAAVAQT